MQPLLSRHVLPGIPANEFLDGRVLARAARLRDEVQKRSRPGLLGIQIAAAAATALFDHVPRKND